METVKRDGASLGAGGTAAVLLGSALAVFGLVFTATFVWPFREMSPTLNEASRAIPVLPVGALLLGVCALLAALGERSRSARYTSQALLVLGTATAALAWIPTDVPALQGLSAAFELWQPSDGILEQAVSNSAPWLVAGSLVLLVATASRPVLVRLGEGLAVLLSLTATVAALMFVLGASGTVDSLVFGLIHVFVAHTCATCALRLASERPGFVPAADLTQTRAFFLSSVAWTPLVAVALAALMLVLPVTLGLVAPAVITAAILAPTVVTTVAAIRVIGRRERAAQATVAELRREKEEQHALEVAGGYGSWSYDPANDLLVLSECAAAILLADTNRSGLDLLVHGVEESCLPSFRAWIEAAKASASVEPIVVTRRSRCLELTAVETRFEGRATIRGTVRDVTQVVLAQRARESEVQVLRGVAEKIPDIDFVYDVRSERYVYMNRPIGEILGDAALTGDSFLRDHVVEEHRETLASHIERVNKMRGSEVFESEFRLRSPQGDEVWVRCRSSVFERDEYGMPKLVFGTLQDVTERRELIKRLEESEARYERLAARVPGVIYQFAVDLEGRFSIPYISEACREVFGVGREEVMTKPDEALARTHVEDRAGLFEAIERSRKELSDFNWTGRTVRDDGRTIWIRASSRPTRLDDGTTLWDGVAIDVTASVEAQQALEQTKERLDFLLSESPTVVYDCEPAAPYRVRFVAPNLRNLLGFVPEQIVGKPVFGVDFVHPDDQELFLLHKKRFVDHGRSSVEYRLRTISGDYVWVRDDIRIVATGAAEPEVVGAWTDISVQRRSLERTLASEARLQRLASRVPGMVFELVLHEEGRPEFTYVSSGSYELFDLPPNEVRSRPESLLRLIDPQDKARLYRDLVRTQRDLCDLDWEGKVVLLPGREMWINISARPSVGSDGMTSWAGLATDVTEAREVKNVLVEGELRYAALVNSSSDAVVNVDEEGAIVLVNPVAERLTGYLSHELVGRPFSVLSGDLGGLNAALEDAGQRKLGSILTREGKTTAVEATIAPFDWNGRRHLTVIMSELLSAVPDDLAQRPGPSEAAVTATEPRVLAIGPERTVTEALGPALTLAGASVTLATTAGLGLELAKRTAPSLVVLFDGVPDANPEGILKAMRADEDLAQVPVIAVGVPEDSRPRLMKFADTTVSDFRDLAEIAAASLSEVALKADF